MSLMPGTPSSGRLVMVVVPAELTMRPARSTEARPQTLVVAFGRPSRTEITGGSSCAGTHPSGVVHERPLVRQTLAGPATQAAAEQTSFTEQALLSLQDSVLLAW